jgi:hypothetical protein
VRSYFVEDVVSRETLGLDPPGRVWEGASSRAGSIEITRGVYRLPAAAVGRPQVHWSRRRLPTGSDLWTTQYDDADRRVNFVVGRYYANGTHLFSVDLAFWFLALLVSLPLAWHALARRQAARPGHCRSCGYDLTANTSGRCPECGAAAEAAPARVNP